MKPEDFLRHVQNYEPGLTAQVNPNHAMACSQGACAALDAQLGVNPPQLPGMGRGARGR